MFEEPSLKAFNALCTIKEQFLIIKQPLSTPTTSQLDCNTVICKVFKTTTNNYFIVKLTAGMWAYHLA